MAKRDKLNFYIDPPDNAQLTKLSEKTGAPVAVLLRRAVKDFLKKVQGKQSTK